MNNPIIQAREAAGAEPTLYRHPSQRQRGVGPRFSPSLRGVEVSAVAGHRQRIEAVIEHLLALLDMVDGDPDFEEQHDAEPDETDHNGDEGDFSRSEDDATDADLWGLRLVPIEGGQGL